ncbi:MAG: hypothetical protein JWN88_3158 [Frankiales bacterium]|nr:hypothetical protein [Frankiales bacterium]
MADLGNSSQADTAHKHKMTSWLTVLVLVVASVVLGFAMVLQSMPLWIAGGVLVVVGTVMAFAFKIMEDAV